MELINLWRRFAAILCAAALITPPVEARTHKGDRLIKEGQKAEASQDYDHALTSYEQALEEDPREPIYQLAVGRTRQKAAQQHIAEGRKMLEQQKPDAALVQFQKALMIDPSSPIALQMVMQADQMVKEKAKAPDGAPILTPAERAQKEMEMRINSLEGPPVLRPIGAPNVRIKFNNQTARVIYESIGKLAGINVLFDPQGIDTMGSTTKNFNLDLNDATLEEALQYVALVTHTFWKPISRNAIFVTQESESKRQEYQDEVVKVFYIQNASTANEFTEIFNGVRIGAKLAQGIFQVASQNAIIARGTPDTMALVEKLVHDLDRPKAEVLVDVKVWEVSKSKTSSLGAALSGNLLTLTQGTSTTSTSSGTSTTTTSSGISLSRLGKLSSNNFSVTLPGAIAQALVSDSNTRLLQNPQVRITDGGKGSLKIGQKIPYVSGSLNSAVATPGSVPYATTQFQQIDVGVNIDVQPHVNGPNDVSMHIKVEISTESGTVTIAGISQPIISQKVNEADVRMKDGEYSLLGGLSSDSDQTGISGLPGFSAVPVLGYLFGTRTKDREKDDILIALVPRIIRAQPVDEQLAEGVLAGTEKMVRVERKSAPAPVNPAVPNSVPRPAGAGTAPQAPPPLGQSELRLRPTNNPRMPAVAQQLTVPPQPTTATNVAPAVAATASASQLPPGTEVTPVEGLQQMGLAPDPVQTATPEGASEGAAAGNGTALTAGQDTQDTQAPASSPVAPVTQETEPAPVQAAPASPEPAPAPASANPESASYATAGPVVKTRKVSSTTQLSASKPAIQTPAVAKPTNIIVKVQLASGTTQAPTTTSSKASATRVVKPAAGPQTAAAAQTKQNSSVQLLEGHLTQTPDAPTTSTKQQQK